MTDRLLPDQTLDAPNSLTSPNGLHRLDMQGDGHLVLYASDGTPVWGSGTFGLPIGGVIMQSDGNLVMYDNTGTPRWASGTDGHPGAFLVLQDDGNLVIYDPAGTPLWASGTNMVSVRVPGFLPSVNGFAFPNQFNHVPDIQIPVGTGSIAIGDAANGLCGGMVFAVRDLFQARRRPPPTTTAPDAGPLFDYLVRRLFDSFDLPIGPMRYLALMSPLLPDHETVLSQAGFAPHGRGWVAMKEEWPLIRASLDRGRLTPMALIRKISANPMEMGDNHQVLAWGYDLRGDDLTILVYDPNLPLNDSVRIRLSLANPAATTQMRHNGGNDALIPTEVFSFFAQPYRFSRAPRNLVAAPTVSRLTIRNTTAIDQTIRVFAPGDTVMLVTLTAGEFKAWANPNGEARLDVTWIFPMGMPAVRVTAEGRPLGIFGPGARITLTFDPSVMVTNATAAPIRVRFYNARDILRFVTLPGGDITILAGESGTYTLPADVPAAVAVIGASVIPVSAGSTVTFAG